MSLGPGKYDDTCTFAREATGADAVVLMVVGGIDGSGFCVQSTSPEFAAELPRILRLMADDIEADTRRTGWPERAEAKQ